MGGDGALAKPGLYPSNYKLTVCGDLLHLRVQRGGCSRADEGISKVAIDFAKIFPAAGT
jgi:hypothetical protein